MLLCNCAKITLDLILDISMGSSLANVFPDVWKLYYMCQSISSFPRHLNLLRFLSSGQKMCPIPHPILL